MISPPSNPPLKKDIKNGITPYYLSSSVGGGVYSILFYILFGREQHQSPFIQIAGVPR